MAVTWDYDNPYLGKFVVNKVHIDELDHTNNQVYASWCEKLAWDHSRELGLEACHYKQLKRAMAIHEANYNYLLPSFCGDDIIAATWLTASDNRLTMERCFQMRLQSSGKCLFRGQWKLICINLETNKPARLPKEFVDIYLPHVVKPI